MDMDNPEAAQLLRLAATYIDAALATLNRGVRACPHHCGRDLAINFDHNRVYDRLDALPEKLRVSAGRLDNAADYESQHGHPRPQVCACRQGTQS